MKKVLIILAVVLALILFLVLGVVLVRRFLAQPLAEPTAVDTTQEQEFVLLPTEAAEEGDELEETDAPEPTVASQPTKEPQPAGGDQGICGNTGKIRILLVGADYSIGMPPFGADAIRVLQIDFDDATMSTVAFPRALVVNTDALGDPLKSQMELGTSFYEMKQVAQGTNTDKVVAATRLLAQVMYDNFEVNPNYYITFQLDTIGAVIDAIGGIEVDLPEAITTERGVSFPAGLQTLNGRLTTELVRTTKSGGEPARLERQEMVMDALQKKLLSADFVLGLPELLAQFQGAIVTDLSPEQLLSVVCAYEQIPNSSETYKSIMGNQYVSTDENGRMTPKFNEIKDLLEDTFGD
jgi:LCP family protein required for cell wall assembly